MKHPCLKDNDCWVVVTHLEANDNDFAFYNTGCLPQQLSFTPRERPKVRDAWVTATLFVLVSEKPMVFLTHFPKDAAFWLYRLTLYLLALTGFSTFFFFYASHLPTPKFLPRCQHLGQSNLRIGVRVEHIYQPKEKT